MCCQSSRTWSPPWLRSLHQGAADREAIASFGALAALREQELRDQRRVSDELWVAREWYEGQLAALRARLEGDE